MESERASSSSYRQRSATARKELALAWQQFDQAEPAFIDAAILQAEPAFIDAAILRLAAAEQTYCALLKERKISHERRNSLEVVQ